ncbi:PDZ domain-containing protein [Streptomyces cinnabarinus]|uniref:PDZ domain-containing protein n=1 Tax=Streptomyces cinnabarinus TaxID=67287 RepID=A0ABY7KPL2_9ACTN|nr:PDZ domain-containing protein [Streptomyces cinnabarinus]WAZ24861.1 PDZ domain-containing protein [Streptomyces cinnabarinus]
MEHTALRPKPMPGQEPAGSPRKAAARRPHAARRRGRRLTTLLFALFVGTVLVLSGVGLGTVGATVIGMSRLAELQQAGQGATTAAPGARAHGAPSASLGPRPTLSATPGPAPAPAGATLGVEAVDAEKAGARVVGVHVPGPGYSAGLVRGDILLVFGRTRIDTAADLARAVADAEPGSEVTLTVRHASGGYQQLTVVPGVVT